MTSTLLLNHRIIYRQRMKRKYWMLAAAVLLLSNSLVLVLASPILATSGNPSAIPFSLAYTSSPPTITPLTSYQTSDGLTITVSTIEVSGDVRGVIGSTAVTGTFHLSGTFSALVGITNQFGKVQDAYPFLNFDTVRLNVGTLELRRVGALYVYGDPGITPTNAGVSGTGRIQLGSSVMKVIVSGFQVNDVQAGNSVLHIVIHGVMVPNH